MEAKAVERQGVDRYAARRGRHLDLAHPPVLEVEQ
jgi:hypothetical protein